MSVSQHFNERKKTSSSVQINGKIKCLKTFYVLLPCLVYICSLFVHFTKPRTLCSYVADFFEPKLSIDNYFLVAIKQSFDDYSI